MDSVKQILLCTICITCFFCEAAYSQDLSDREFSFDTNASDLTHPKTGFLFIEYVSGLAIDSLYALAENRYFSSIEQSARFNDDSFLREELNRLKPIVNSSTYKNWSRLIRRDKEELVQELKRYWELENPIISTPYNERLIEHWERIYWAKRKFIINDKTGFGSDERGALFVKLGEPDLIKRRNVSLSSYSDPVTGNTIPIQNNVQFSIELWYYDTIQYVFGIPGSGGPFGLQSGILELIPEAGNRPIFFFDPTENMVQLTNRANRAQTGSSGDNPISQRSTSSGLAGTKQLSRNAATLLLQYSVLEQIADIDPFYLNLFNRMNQDLIQNTLNGSTNSFNSTALTQNIKYKSLEKNWAVNKEIRTPEFVSGTKPVSNFHELKTYRFNFLDQNLNPILLLITELNNLNDVELYLAQKAEVGINQIKRKDFFVSSDDFGESTVEEIGSASLTDVNYSSVNSYIINSSDSEVLFQSSFINTSAEVNEVITSSQTILLSFNESLREGLNRNRFSVSDIFLADNQQENTATRIPFFPSLTNQFRLNEEPIVYFEVYGIPKDEMFEVEYGREKSGNKLKVRFTSEALSNKIWFKVKLDQEVYPKGDHIMEFNISYMGRSSIKKVKIHIN